MIMRSVKIDQFVAELLENPQRGGRSVDELAIAFRRRESARFRIKSSSHGSIPASSKRGFHFREFVALKNRFDRAHIRSSPDQRFVGAFAEQQLERADDDRFAGAGFACDSDEPRRDFPFQFFDQREIFDSKQIERQASS